MRLINHQKDFFLSHPSIKKNKMIKSYYLKLLAIIVLVNQVHNLDICDHPLTNNCVITQQEEWYYDQELNDVIKRIKNISTPYCVNGAALGMNRPFCRCKPGYYLNPNPSAVKEERCQPCHENCQKLICIGPQDTDCVDKEQKHFLYMNFDMSGLAPEEITRQM